MTYVEESIKEVNEMIPEDGFNVCYFDDFADAGEKLTLIKHCETREEAEEIVKEHEDEIVYIYEGENEAEEGMSVHKNHNIDKYLDIALKDYLEGKSRPNIEYEDTNYGGEFKPTAHGIENMIDDIASKSLSEDEKKQIEDSDELKKDFSLNTLLDLIADKLDKKDEKKLGVEGAPKDRYGWFECPYGDFRAESEKPVQMHARDVHGLELGHEGKPFSEWTKDDLYRSECQICGAPLEEHPITEGNDPHEWLAEEPEDYKGDMSLANEGGRGSGRVGHKKWMLAGEVGEECPNCMMITDRNDNGKCILCGQ